VNGRTISEIIPIASKNGLEVAIAAEEATTKRGDASPRGRKDLVKQRHQREP
jgi:hypothetical protein